MTSLKRIVVLLGAFISDAIISVLWGGLFAYIVADAYNTMTAATIDPYLLAAIGSIAGLMMVIDDAKEQV